VAIRFVLGFLSTLTATPSYLPLGIRGFFWD
jgi:hypothetical protein